MEKIVVYTGAFGENYGLVPQKKIDGVDFFCFTDNQDKVVFPWKPISLKDNIGDNVRRNRHPKILPHLYFQDYDISVYIDSNFLIIGDILQLLSDLGEFKMAIFDHNQCVDKCNCIYQEHKNILKLGEERGWYKDNLETMQKQIDFLKKEGYPTDNGLISAAVLIRRHNNTSVINVMEDWWHMVSTMSKRDQLSFNYAAWKNNFNPKIIDGAIRRGNSFFYFLSFPKKNYTFKLYKYYFKKFFGIEKRP